MPRQRQALKIVEKNHECLAAAKHSQLQKIFLHI